ncbi:hypothetical protein PAXRUDRAFT_835267 [Paxillus rubicundulus Ve08.2h10]|uniref:Unplaced genomic scaffold scaffold_2531, whole genome shotgun sequence n=1 Tax=Paxillus rubicundulus Ve08.2h10 TaxID=930991 RepID=A0A0D0D8H2_9AGAM|nr:hypothetical protein PAXRUDRAFT_835267 [Paxillus rubicundulus Ve08.2h10]
MMPSQSVTGSRSVCAGKVLLQVAPHSQTLWALAGSHFQENYDRSDIFETANCDPTTLKVAEDIRMVPLASL